MINRVDVIENPVTGERIQFLISCQDTQGESLSILHTIKPHDPLPAMHIHLVNEEHLLIEAGTAGLKLGDQKTLLSAGQELIIPPGTPHAFWNTGEEELSIQVGFHPALLIEDYFVSLFALARAGKTDQNGRPGLLQRAMMLSKYWYEVTPAGSALVLKRWWFKRLAWIAEKLGHRPNHPYHLDGVDSTLYRSEGVLEPAKVMKPT